MNTLKEIRDVRKRRSNTFGLNRTWTLEASEALASHGWAVQATSQQITWIRNGNASARMREVDEEKEKERGSWVSGKMNAMPCRPVSLVSLMEMDSTGLNTETFLILRHKYTLSTSFSYFSSSLVKEKSNDKP